ncbi:MAG: hypothetical protein ThorAB25_13460 [Candidatus Thorarchaeota archaeon AB_25]|nr:MAG: hypothetical protein ThorAB25_13460 [Candidatus Thorarchaeota archaeon AB_25]
MDKEGFRKYLTDREQPVPEEQIVENTKMVERFEEFLQQFGKTLETASETEFSKFSKILIEEGLNTYLNYAALSRYAYFIKNMDLYLPVLAIFDGGEVMNVLHERLGEHVGEEKRDEILPKKGLPPLGIPDTEKMGVTREVMEKMEKVLDPTDCKKILADVAHGLPRDFRKGEREKFVKAGGIDEYLKQKRENAIAELEKHRDDGSLFYNQYITDVVVEFVKSRSDVLSGERRGNTIYHTKIPYMVQEYLEETDKKKKRYYACHCAWARESILDDVDVSANFCHCSGGFTKMPWEAALDQPLEYEMVKSVLKGDDECSFIIHLPKDVE